MGYKMVGKVLFHIGYVGVDKATREAVTPITETADKTNALRRTDDILRPFGFVRDEEAQTKLSSTAVG